MNLKEKIRTIKDFPKEGILFSDITTVLKDADAMVYTIDLMAKELEGLEYDLILGPESRGFIFGMPLAYKEKKGFVPVRKAGKLPAEVYSKSYDLEYGAATIEIHKDALEGKKKVVIADDLLATGGTCKALVELCEEAGCEVVGLVFFIELEELGGRKSLEKYNISSILKY
ncbi:MAG: adenine phosphoribosyltransferase [Lachnospirales bacterium]